MSPVKAMMYFMCVNGMLSLFSIVGVFSMSSQLGASGWSVDLNSTLGNIGFTGIAGVVGGFTFIVAYMSGISPIVAMAYGVVVGFFTKTFTTVFSLMYNIQKAMPEGGAILGGFILIIASIYAISVIWTLVQMATGGTESYE